MELPGWFPPLPGMESAREVADIEQDHLGKPGLQLLCYCTEGTLLHTTLALAHMHPLLKYQPDSHRLTALGDW